MTKKSAGAAARAKAHGTARSAPARQMPTPSDRWLVYGTVPLRFFLGATFVYAGLQKIADPGFLQPGSTTYIGTQLHAFAGQSPIGFVLRALALPAPQLAGVGVILAEVVLGTMVLLGIATRWAAAAGALLSFVLFLTASWLVQPYFLGSDSIYTVAWITLVLVGDQGVLSLEAPLRGWIGIGATAIEPGADMGRRRLLLQLGGAAVAVVWALALLPRSRQAQQAAASPEASAARTPAASPIASPTGTRVGTLATLNSQGFIEFTDPTTGDPGVAVELSGGAIVAFDEVCTHQGCQVAYDTTSRLLSCPCHGATFDPANGAAVLSGPAPTPLAAIRIQVGSDGGVYAV